MNTNPAIRKTVEQRVSSESALGDVAGDIAAQLRDHWGGAQETGAFVIYLDGELGAGKTSFTRAFIRRLGYEGRVKSPSYALLEHYLLQPFAILHMDCYRITDPEEIQYLGLMDLLNNAVLVVEWPEMGRGNLPPPDLRIQITEAPKGESTGPDASNARDVALTAFSPLAEVIISKLRKKSTFSD